MILPSAWRSTIRAYYLDDGGPDAVEWQTHNLRQALQRVRELFQRGHMDLAQFEQQAQALRRELEALKPSAHPAAAALEPALADFPALWRQMLPDEKRRILQVIFAGIYIDAQAQVRRVQAHEPFDQLLQLPEDGLIGETESQPLRTNGEATPPGH